MKRPSKELQKKYATEYNDSTVFAANARLMQSIWREEYNIPKQVRKYSEVNLGNYINDDFAFNKKFNFINQNIKDVVDKIVLANQKSDPDYKKFIKPKILYKNLISSQALTFNLFAELFLDLKLSTKVFKSLFPREVKSITSIEFEVSPHKNDFAFTGDSTIYDIFIKYEGSRGKSFFAIEVKYSESLMQRQKYNNYEYKKVADKSWKYFKDGIEKLNTLPPSLEQIWREHLLCLSMLHPINNYFHNGRFIYIYPKDNTQCSEAINQYSKYLVSSNYKEHCFFPLEMERFVDVIKKHTKKEWIFKFYDRYLNFDKIKHYEQTKYHSVSKY